jgi:hypothetical protein
MFKLREIPLQPGAKCRREPDLKGHGVKEAAEKLLHAPGTVEERRFSAA